MYCTASDAIGEAIGGAIYDSDEYGVWHARIVGRSAHEGKDWPLIEVGVRGHDRPATSESRIL